MMKGRAQIYPVIFIWRRAEVTDEHGEVRSVMAMVPKGGHFAALAARQYHDGEPYPLAPLEPRSRASHSHYFAALNEGFKQLPETIAARFPTPEHLRKWMLIETDWCEEDEFGFANDREAKAAMTKIRKRDAYARISRHGKVVIVRYAVSQSAQAMGKEKFEASKKDVLDLLAGLIGTTVGTLKANAGMSA